MSAPAFSSGPCGAGGGVLAGFAALGLGGWLALDLAINWAAWAVAAALKTEKFYDAVGSLSFMTLAVGSLALSGTVTPRKLLASAMVVVWTARLGSYLIARIHKTGKDARFDDVKDKPAKFFAYWTMQGLWVFITLAPVLIVNTASAAAPLTWIDLIGTAVWGGGLALEAVADKQKDAWRSRPENRGKFIDEGLWSVSRHPNYLGEMILWWGVFAVCAPGFTQPLHYASVASPVVVALLLNFVSGIPLVEKQADERWGHLAEYQAYKARTPVLLPSLASIRKQGRDYEPLPQEPSPNPADPPAGGSGTTGSRATRRSSKQEEEQK